MLSTAALAIRVPARTIAHSRCWVVTEITINFWLQQFSQKDSVLDRTGPQQDGSHDNWSLRARTARKRLARAQLGIGRVEKLEIGLSPGKAPWAALPCCRICPWVMSQTSRQSGSSSTSFGALWVSTVKGASRENSTPTALPSSQPRSQTL